MATSNSSDSKCVTCVKSIGTFTCRGCQQDFCITHAAEHRQMLSIQMDEDIIPLHDQLQENLLEQTKKFVDHPLMKQIDKWENESIEKIHQTAKKAREDLLFIIEKHTNEIKQDFVDLTKELKTARNNDQFFENNLKEWIQKLNHLSTHLEKSPEINFQYLNNNPSFISNILINELLNERFQQTIGNINITDHGFEIIHNQTNTYASVCGLKDYSQGEHHLHFQIEYLTSNWVFFGIISKDAPLPDYPSIGKTAYGWSGSNNVWRDGNRTNKLENYISDFNINDQINLVINCDQRRINLTNQRTNITYLLNVNINDCPLPWKLSVGLFHSPGERIRLIQS